jgi:hypothetical protein
VGVSRANSRLSTIHRPYDDDETTMQIMEITE